MRHRYVIGDEIGSGGMATVHLGGMVGDAGFSRAVAIKRLHPQYAKDPDLSAMLLAEGRLAARVVHVNVVTTLDVVASERDLFIVMEYVHGEPLNKLLRAVVRAGTRIPPRVAAGILAGALRGLHAAHEARDAYGRLLGVVHRDVSPQNIMVGADGIPRVLDFGIAKAAGHAHTETGQIKGKFAYMPMEQLQGEELDRRADVYAAGVVLWESLVGARLFAGVDNAPNLAKLLDPKVEPPSARAPEIDADLDSIVLTALARDRDARYPTALAMAEALEADAKVASPAEIAAWVQDVAGPALAERAQRIAATERDLVQRIRDSQSRLDALEETVTDASLLDLPPPDLLPQPPPDEVDATTEPWARAAPRPSTSRGRIAAIAAALVAIAALLLFLVTRGSPDHEAVASVAAPPAPLPATVTADPQDPPAPTAPQVSADPPLPSSTPSAPKPHTPVSKARTRPSNQACSPPYTIDAQGHKHYKRACLR
jgi:eukaryotic-like serine/threonine-protein kinase